ncbi:MAG: hypothetical protein PHH84_04360 [Oscillospiraceae bacterium]|nr:hypothetical protein [Oscillospiraceae bacterium]
MLLMVHPESFYSKPKKESNRFLANKFNTLDFSIVQVCKAVVNGQTIRPGVFDRDSIKESSWKQQQLFFVDIDRGMSVNNSFSICERLNLEPSIIYPSFSYTFENQKHRIVFCFEEVINNAETSDYISRKLADIFQADTNALRRNQFFYGSNTQFFFDCLARLNLGYFLNLGF